MTSWFQKPSRLKRPRAERRISPGLVANYLAGSALKQDSISNISATGAYLLTRERWSPGTLISLILQREGPPETSPEHRIELQARAVRSGQDGVGFSFVLPPGMDVCLWWGNPLVNESDQLDPESVLREFRLAEALAFLDRICPSITDQVALFLREGLSNYRVLSAVEIALEAEQLLASVHDADKMQVPPHILLRIIEAGSWAEEDWLRQFWAGILATSCTVQARDESNLKFVELLGQLATVHARIFRAACSKAVKVLSGPDEVSARPLVCTSTEMMNIVASSDLVRLDRDLDFLADIGLIKRKVKSSFFSPLDDREITPTSLALHLYARCNGHRGAPQDFYGIVASGALSIAQ